jgi:RNA methyltransferase, TrmH family
VAKPTITSSANPLIKQARALRQRKARAEAGLFLAEGIHPVGQALEAGWSVEALLYAPELLISDFANDLIGRAASVAQPVSETVMRALTDKDNPQGLLAIVRQRRVALDDLAAIRSGAAVLSPQDPGNVGTILRTLDAVGADALFLLDGGVDAYHPTSVRASMGALFWKSVVSTSFAEFIRWAAQHQLQLIGTTAHASTDYRSFTPARDWLLVLGSEQKGLSDEQLAQCATTVALPMRGHASSLNLAVAAGILLYRFSAAPE